MSVRVDGVVASIGTAIHRALDNQKVQHEFGAVNERAVVIGVLYTSLIEIALKEVEKSRITWKLKDGVLFLVYPDGASPDELETVNSDIIRKMKAIGVDAQGYISNDGSAVLTVNLNDIALKILENAVDEAKKKLGGRMRLIRIKFINDDKWGYMLIYRRNERPAKKVDPGDLSHLAV